VFDVDALAAEDRSAWSAGARLARLVEVRAAQERLDAEVLRLIGDCDAVDAWQVDRLGAVSWLASKTGLLRGAAARLVRTARFLRRHPRTAKALAAGDVTAPHVEQLAAVAHRRETLCERDETVLLDAAATVEVQDFPKVTRQWVSLADDELARREAAYAFDRRRFTLSPTTRGSAVSGFVDPEASALIAAVFDETQPPDGKHDTRTRAQRWADALVLLCERARGGPLGETRPIAGVEAVFDHDGLRCEIEGFGPIPTSTVERLLCDCALGRVVMQAAASSSTSAAARARCRSGSGVRSSCATSTASSPAAGRRRRGATPTTSSGGPTAEPRACGTWCSCVADITWRCTRVGGSSSAAPTASRWSRDRSTPRRHTVGTGAGGSGPT
jgi:hypothetical protein